mgnify:FL=1
MSKFELPATLIIVGKTYTVQYDPNIHGAAFGRMLGNKQLILVDPDQIKECEQDTLLHECIHAIDFQLQIGLKEQQVNNLATGLIMLLKQNPVFTGYLLDILEKPFE